MNHGGRGWAAWWVRLLLCLALFPLGLQAQGPASSYAAQQAAQQHFLKWFQQRYQPSPALLRTRDAVSQMFLKLRAMPRVSPRPHPLRAAADAASAPAWQPFSIAPMKSQQYGAESGVVNAIVPDPTDSSGNTIYVATAGGVWKSTNALSSSPTFTPLSDNAPWLSAGAIAIDSSTSPATLYVGTGSQWGMYGVGILKSSDGGESWALVSAADDGLHPFLGLDFSSIVIDPQNPRHLLAAAASGWRNAAVQITPGLYSSSDAGQTWQLALSEKQASGTFADVTSLAVDSASGAYYAAFTGVGYFNSADGKVWKAMTMPDALNNPTLPWISARAGVVIADGLGSSSATTINAAFSRDGGATWSALRALPVRPFGMPIPLWISPGGDMAFDASYGAIDSVSLSSPGAKWQQRGASFSSTPAFGAATTLALMSDTAWFAAGPVGIWGTSDGGTTWTDDNQTLDTTQVFQTAAIRGVVAEATNEGLFQAGGSVASQGGGQFTLSPSTFLFQLVTTGYDDSIFGFGGVPSESSQVLYSVSSGQSIISMDKLGTGAASQYGSQEFDIDNGNGELVVTNSNGLRGLWMGPPDATASGQWVSLGDTGPLDFVTAAPADGSRLYTGSIFARTLFTTDDPQDSNPAFQNINIPGLSGACTCPEPRPDAIAVSPADPKIVYVGTDGTMGQEIFKSMDGGQSWNDITGNLPTGAVGAILVDPRNPDDIYVGNALGVFVATDGGTSGEQWAVYGAGLPPIPIDSLTFSSSGQLLASTFGRGVWQIAPLVQKTDFDLRFQNGSISASSGQGVSLTLDSTALFGSTAPITLTCVAPAVGCSLASNQLSNPDGASTTVSIDGSQVKPPMKVVIRATDGTNTHVLTGFIHPQNGFSFVLQNRDVYAQAGGKYPMDLSESAGLLIGPASTPVTVSCPGLPAGLHCFVGVPSDILYPRGKVVNGFIDFSADASLASGSYPVTIQATDETNDTATVTVTVHVSDFALTTPNLTPAASSTYSLPITATGNGTEQIALSCAPGTLAATCSFQPSTMTPGQTSTLTVTNVQLNSAPPAASSGQVLDVIGTAGTITAQLDITIPPPASVGLSFPAIAVPLLAGTDTASFAGTVADGASLTCTAPKGVQCAVTTGAAASSTSTQVTAALSGLASVSGATVPVTVTAALGTQMQSQVLTVQVLDFGVAPATPPAPVLAGTGTATIALKTTAQSGFNGAIDLSCASGVSCSFAPAHLLAGQGSTLTVSGLAAQSGTIAVTVNAASGSLQHQLPLSIPIADFQLAAASATATVATGTDTASFTITDTSVNGFTDAVQLACSAGVTCSFSPASLPAGGSSTLTVSGLASQPAGTVKFTVTGTDGADSHTLPLAIAVVTPAPAVSLSPASLSFSDTVNVGSKSASAQTVTLTNSGNAPLTISGITAPADFTETDTCVSGSPLAAGATCTISVTFAPQSGGNLSETLAIADTAAGSPQSVALAGTAEGLAAQPAQGSSTDQSVKAGGTADYALSLQPANGATGVFALSCAVQDGKGAVVAGTKCVPQPASIDVSSGTAQNVTIAVTTTAPSSAAGLPEDLPGKRPGTGTTVWGLLVLLLLSLGLRAPGSRRRPRLIRVSAAAGILGLLFLAGCGGGSKSSPPPANTTTVISTPAGQYTVQLKATQASTSQTVNLKLTVN